MLQSQQRSANFGRLGAYCGDSEGSATRFARDVVQRLGRADTGSRNAQYMSRDVQRIHETIVGGS